MPTDDLTLAQEQVLRRIEAGCSTDELVDTLRSVFARGAALATRQRFLGDLDVATRALVEPTDLMQTTARLLAEHLGVDRCAYANVIDEAVFDITGDYARGVPSIVGRWEVAAFGPGCVADMLANRPYVVTDTDTDPRIPPDLLAAYRATTIRAVICVPLHKGGRFTAAMAVHQTVPRLWTSEEIELVAIVVGRSWEALERAGVERALVADRARVEYAVQLSGIGFWYCDLPFGELMWDARVKAHFFLPPEARVTIDTFYERIHPDDREPTREAIEASIANRTSYDTIYRTVHPATGEEKHVRALGGTYYAPDGTPLRFDGVTVDVTEQKRTEALLRDQDRRKDEFLATLAHELRNPLAPIRTGLELIQQTTDGSVVQRTHRMMERQLVHLVRMVDDLLDISRVTLGKVQLLVEALDVRTVIESAVETVRPLIAKQGLELVVDVPAASIVVQGDPTRLSQVISNLLSNAAKYTPRGGRVTIAATPQEGAVAIRVTDTGIGIPPAKLPEVFELFSQLGQTIDRANGGLGIGLTLARRLVELHGGTIGATSAGENRGATFVVTLPLRGNIPVVSPPTAPVRHVAPTSILVVDDNVDAADAVAMVLELDGHRVCTAHNGPDALTVAAAQRPDLILLDIGLPGIDGYEVARRLRADPALRTAYLVALTGWGSDDDRRAAREAGFDEHLVKPVERVRLVSLVASLRSVGA